MPTCSDWLMQKLRGLQIDDFTRLHTINGIEYAPALEVFNIGNAVWLGEPWYRVHWLTFFLLFSPLFLSHGTGFTGS